MAEADAFYGYNGLVGGYTGYALPAYRSYAAPAYRTYAAPAYTTGYANYGYAGLNAGHYIGKREAEAEPEADADAFYGYNGLFNGYNGYALPAYRSYAAPAYTTGYANYGYAGLNAGHYIGKREA